MLREERPTTGGNLHQDIQACPPQDRSQVEVPEVRSWRCRWGIQVSFKAEEFETSQTLNQDGKGHAREIRLSLSEI